MLEMQRYTDMTQPLPCWQCGGPPQQHNRTLAQGLDQHRLECCTSGQWCVRDDMMIATWNRVQGALGIRHVLDVLEIDTQPFLDLYDGLYRESEPRR